MSKEDKNMVDVLKDIAVQLKQVNASLNWSVQWQKMQERTPLEKLQSDSACPFCVAYKKDPTKCVKDPGCKRTVGYDRYGQEDKFEFDGKWKDKEVKS